MLELWRFQLPSLPREGEGPARQLSKGLGSGSWLKQSSQLVRYGFSCGVLFRAQWLLYESALQCTEVASLHDAPYVALVCHGYVLSSLQPMHGH